MPVSMEEPGLLYAKTLISDHNRAGLSHDFHSNFKNLTGWCSSWDVNGAPARAAPKPPVCSSDYMQDDLFSDAVESARGGLCKAAACAQQKRCDLTGVAASPHVTAEALPRIYPQSPVSLPLGACLLLGL